jgi:hypothetical protein
VRQLPALLQHRVALARALLAAGPAVVVVVLRRPPLCGAGERLDGTLCGGPRDAPRRAPRASATRCTPGRAQGAGRRARGAGLGSRGRPAGLGSAGRPGT